MEASSQRSILHTRPLLAQEKMWILALEVIFSFPCESSGLAGRSSILCSLMTSRNAFSGETRFNEVNVSSGSRRERLYGFY
ncbi:hypothetical protein Tco_0791206 [Tanacetum coccineum]